MPTRTGGKRRKRRTHAKSDGPEQSDGVPRSLVVARGKVPLGIRELISDLRAAFAPHTAVKLRERKSNSLRDYVSVAASLHVTHVWMMSATEQAPYLRIARVPQGPTLTFRINEYTTATHVRATHRRPVLLGAADRATPPLLVLNNFGGNRPEVKLTAETLRNAFPSIDVNSLKLSSARRVLLIDRDTDTSGDGDGGEDAHADADGEGVTVGDGKIRLRHYALRVQQAGLSKPVRRLVRGRVPSMRKFTDVAEYMDEDAAGYSSESDVEDVRGEEAAVTLAQDVRKVKKGAPSKVKLVEVGPRVTLELVKIEAGLCQGAVLHHAFVKKSKEEVAEDRARVDTREQLRKKRKAAQEENVRRKQQVKKARKERRKVSAARAEAQAQAQDGTDET